jgi:hypothetical protein
MDGILRRGADAFSVQGTGHGAAAAGPPLAQTANALELGAVPAARGQELLEEPFELRLLAPGERLQKLGQGDAAGDEQIVEHRLPLGGEVEGETAPPAGAGPLDPAGLCQALHETHGAGLREAQRRAELLDGATRAGRGRR